MLVSPQEVKVDKMRQKSKTNETSSGRNTTGRRVNLNYGFVETETVFHTAIMLQCICTQS